MEDETPDVAGLSKRVERERQARQKAELLAEQGTRQLYERQRELELLNVITDAANGATSVHEAIQVTLDEMCIYTGWPVGHAYFVGEDPVMLIPSRIWHLDQPAHRFETFRKITETTNFHRGEGLPGIVWETGRSFWIPDVSQAANFPRAKHSLDIGVVAAFAFPVLAGTTVTAVLEFFSGARAETEETWLKIATQAGIQLGRIFERQRASAELKRANEELLELSRLKSEFLANVSHEIRTPINGVIGMTDLLLMTDLSSEQHEFARLARTSSESLLLVINDILDFSKIEAGKLELAVTDFNLREIIEDTMDLMAAQSRGKSLELAALIRPEVPLFLRGDPGRLRQVLNNLIGNAVKFTSHGEIVLTVSRRTEEDIPLTLDFEVRDTGIGISAEVLARLFQAFSQADGSNTRKYGGTGLGLVISRKLVQMMGGDIRVSSEVGEGSAFSFFASFEEQAVTPLVAKENLAGIRVLMVDNNATTRALVEHCAQGWKMKSRCVSDGDEALELLHQAVATHAYELVILDLQMPGMDGMSLARTIKGDLALRSTHLLALSSFENLPNEDELKGVGIEACVLKPIKESRLYERICEIMTDQRPVPATEALPTSVPERTPLSGESLKIPIRVLIAEDNIINQKVVLGLLRKLGLDADVANNGREVLAALDRRSYDVILMDCQMPELDGYETARRIRARNDCASLRIIALTANALPGESEKCLAAGMNDYLSKPVRLELLQNKLTPEGST